MTEKNCLPLKCDPEVFQSTLESQYVKSPDAKWMATKLLEEISIELVKCPNENNLVANKKILQRLIGFIDNFERRMSKAGLLEQYKEAFGLFYDNYMNGEKFGDITISRDTPVYFVDFLQDLLANDYLISEIENKISRSKNDLEVKDIYYSICWLGIQFRSLGDKFKSEEDQITSLYFSFRQSLGLLRDNIFHRATIKGIRLNKEVNVKDYNLSGRYLNLYTAYSDQSNEPKEQFSTRSAAMVCYFRGDILKENNSRDIAVKEFEKGPKEGERLYQYWKKMCIRFEPNIPDDNASYGAHLKQLGQCIQYLEEHKLTGPLQRAKTALES